MGFLFSKSKNKAVRPAKNERNINGNFCKVYAISETGPVRDHNEDSIAFSFPENNEENLIAVVADGMGGHNAGEVASKIACDVLLDFCLRNWKEHAPEKLLKNAFLEAHHSIISMGNANPEQKGMGTTATAILFKKGICYLGHIGDSRAYLLRNRSLTQLSKDHTLVNQMFENGEITETERDRHPMKNVLLQALGTTPTIQPQIVSDGWHLKEGDRLLLCSDGVYDVFSNDDIRDFLLMEQAEFALECLSTMAISRKVSDNYSSVLIEISPKAQPLPSLTKEHNLMR